jgi:hypothetical protein
MKMKKKNNLNLFLPVGLLLAFLLSSGCDDEVCKEGASECVGTRAIRICAKGDDDNYWIPVPCGEGEVCQDFGAAPESDAGTANGSSEVDASVADAATSSNIDAGTSDDDKESSGNAMCVGTCDKGDRECVTDQVARHCVDGMRWETYRCEDGETCNEGECSRNYDDLYPDLKICEAGEKVCASDELLKICDADGTAWIGVRCEDEEVCENGDCVLKDDALCDPDEGMCDDENNLIRCREDGVGYERIECPDDTRCQYDSIIGDAACVGDLCAIGSSCVPKEAFDILEEYEVEGEGDFIRDCVDGTTFEWTRCEANQRCVEITPWVAQCVDHATECEPGEVVCGDPSEDEVDESLYSICVDDPDDPVHGTIGARWVVHKCVTDDLLCDEDAAELGITMPCVKECTPGEERCAPPDELPVDINHARQVCNEDGTWGDAEPCSVGEEAYLVCARRVQLPGELPEVVCADPVCELNGVVLEDGGTCYSETEWLACDEKTGRLLDSDEAEECESGICQTGLLPDEETTNNTRAKDGRIRGTCLPTECEPEEQRCIRTTEGEYTTRYLTCNDSGEWETKADTCDDNDLCLDYLNDDELWVVICDGECVPGSQECTGKDDDDTDQIRVCDEDGQWGDRTDCDFGICDPLKNECIGQCVPDEKRCVGDPKVASDGYHNGTEAEVKCTEDGVWDDDEEDCDDDTTCRVSGAGVVLGCVECIGPDVVGGNEDGLVDSRCDDDEVQECNEDNDGFERVTRCRGDFECQPPSYGLLCTGYCTGASYHTMICAKQLIQQKCEPCDAVTGLGYIDECTVTELQNAGAIITDDCEGFVNAPSNYLMNTTDATATSENIDVEGLNGTVSVTIETNYYILDSGDYGLIQYSLDGGAWNDAAPVTPITGTNGSLWENVSRTIPVTGNTNLQIRFFFFSDVDSLVYDGWRINSVTVEDTTGGGTLLYEDDEFSSGWVFTGEWGTETIAGPSDTNLVVLTESPADVVDTFDFGTPGEWAGVPNNDCCSDHRVKDETQTCPYPGNTVITNNYTDCCPGPDNTTAIPGASQIAWCIEED